MDPLCFSFAVVVAEEVAMPHRIMKPTPKIAGGAADSMMIPVAFEYQRGHLRPGNAFAVPALVSIILRRIRDVTMTFTETFKAIAAKSALSLTPLIPLLSATSDSILQASSVSLRLETVHMRTQKLTN